MDSRLETKLEKLDVHIKHLFEVERQYLWLEAQKKSILAEITRKSEGKSFTERESNALATTDWKDFSRGLADKEAEFNRERRRYELLMKAFESEYQTYKIEAQVIRKQL